MRVLVVCLGNICRSPTAEAALREAADEAGLDLEVDSAGTAAWHVGNPPDPRMREAAGRAGLPVAGAARQVTPDDLATFDLVVAMDRQNQRDLLALAPDDEAASRVRLLRDYTDQPGTDVPDPYHGGPEGFRQVVGIVREGARGLVAAIDRGDA